MSNTRVGMAAGVLVALSVVPEIVFRHSAHPTFWWHSLPAFDFVYGFLGCTAIVLISKWLGRRFIQQDEDYYDR